MIITVKNLQQQTFTVNFDERKNVLELKKQIFRERGPEYVVEKQKLIYAGIILEDERTIQSYNVDAKKFVVVLIKRDLGPTNPQKPDGTGSLSPRTDSSTPSTSSELEKKNDSMTTENASGEKFSSDEDTKSIGSGGSGNEIKPVGSGTSIMSTTSGTSLLSSGSAGSGDSETSHSTYSSGDLAGVFSNTSLQSRAESNLHVGPEYNCSVEYMIEMGYSREMVERAMHASFNNPERAVEYLISGIPETEEELITVPVGGGTSGSGLPNMEGDNADAALQADPFESLSNQPQFLQMRSLVNENPDQLHAVLQQMAQTNPALLQLISDNQDAFLSMLNQPMDNDNNPTGPEQAQLDPNAGGSGDGEHVQPSVARPPPQLPEAGDPGVTTLPPRILSPAERRAAAVRSFIRERAEAAAALAALTAAASEAVDRNDDESD